MRRRLIKLSVTFIIFVISLFIANALLNKGNTDMTQDMSPASLPIIYMNVNDEYINPHHGYKVAMEGNYLRGSITPLMANRSISFKADLYDSVIAKVAYEVRPLDMSRLIEDTEVSDFTYENNEIYANITLKDLIDDDTEYMLIIKLTTSSGEVIRYYVRVINRSELSIGDKISFVRDFSAKTFNKDTAESLKEYMESNAEGDNSSYAYVNIHSSFNQLTWGNLAPKLKTSKNIEILEIDEETASILVKYQVEIASEIHNVSEFFRVQKGKKRMFLMEYERTMNQIFDEEKNVVVNGKILHGIINEEITKIENDTGMITAFVQQGTLYSYNISTNTMARLFSFYDKNNDDVRTHYDAYDIKPLEIDGVGNARFIVYGYMNRGRHEGEVGVALYYYDCALNTIEEELFIPYLKSPEILENNIERLAYLSPRGRLFILLDNAVYDIDVNTRQIRVMQDSIGETGFYSSDNRKMIAWQIGDSVQNHKEIQVTQLDTMTSSVISANSGEIVIPLGFMESDLVYGTANISDITTGDTGRTVVPMFNVKIQDERGTLLKEYRQEGIYVLGGEKQDNMIILSRAIKDEESKSLIAVDDDQIVNNKIEITMKNKLGSVVTEDTETTYQTILYKEPGTSTLKTTNPKEVVYEGSRSIELNGADLVNKYFIYARGSLVEINTDVADAVNSAQENYGVVIDKRMAYIWESENRAKSKQITSLDLDEKPAQMETEEDGNGAEQVASEDTSYSNYAYAACLDIMLRGCGVYRDTERELQQKSVIKVLGDNIEGQALELSGCNLSAVLYYVSRGYPVMAMTGQGKALLIVGYDKSNTILYDPILKKTYKLGINDSTLLFEQTGNRFVTYVE